MSKKTIMIDMDEVICEGGLLYLINEFLGTNYPKEYFKGFYMQEVIPEELRKEFFDNYLLSHNIYDYCYIYEDAVRVIEQLSKEYEVFIGTDYLIPEIKEKCGINAANKHEFLIKNFPFIIPYNYIFCGNKKMIAADIRIDDKLNNLLSACYLPERNLLFSAYHNKDLTDEYLNEFKTERVNNWREVEKKLLLK